MKLIAKIKLQPSNEQYSALLKTLETANSACNDISERGWKAGVLREYPLHHLVYRYVRECYGLSAQMTSRAIGKVADAYKLDQKTKRTFQLHGAFPYDNRILSFKTTEQVVSIWTLSGRQRMPYLRGERQRVLLEGDRGQANLCFIKNTFYLFVSCEVETPDPKDVDGYLGVDLGIVNLAVDSDGEVYSGEQVERKRRKHAHQRRNLQRKGTRAAKRKLKQISGKQSLYQKDTNHRISKRIVSKAYDTGRGIAVEDLTGIRDGQRIRRKQRARHANWSFLDLRKKIEYKAAIYGVRVVAVDPRNTSRTCAVCGCVDKRNRRTQSQFLCVSCGHSAPADTNAAVNISARASVSKPNEHLAQGGALVGSYKLLTLPSSN